MLERQKQSQQAGDNSTQTIVETQVNYQGISEERAVEIAQRQAQLAIRERFEAESLAVATARITRLDKMIIAKLAAAEMLDALGDPSFLSAFQKAQISAAQTDVESDYELLSGLLVERANRDARKVRASVSKAVEIVDLVDESALAALTAFWLLSYIHPVTGLPEEGLDVLEDLCAPFFADELPMGRGWVEHLDSLNVVRHDGFSTLKTFSAFLATRFSGYVAGGFTEEEASQLTLELSPLLGSPVGAKFLVPHEYRPGYLRFPFHDRESAVEAYLQFVREQNLDGIVEREAGLRRVVEKINDPNTECISLFEESYRRRLHIAKAESWWDQLGNGVTITPIGKALGYVNAKRHHPLDGIDSFEYWVS